MMSSWFYCNKECFWGICIGYWCNTGVYILLYFIIIDIIYNHIYLK